MVIHKTIVCTNLFWSLWYTAQWTQYLQYQQVHYLYSLHNYCSWPRIACCVTSLRANSSKCFIVQDCKIPELPLDTLLVDVW